MENSFDYVYNQMSEAYAQTERAMGNIYEQIKLDPENTQAYEQLQVLGGIARNYLLGQQALVEAYCNDKALKIALLDRINEKSNILSSALESTMSHTK